MAKGQLVSDSLSPKETTGSSTKYESQVTRYGFRNLFTDFKYNPTLPYKNQVNPNVELFMSGYLRKHSSYLSKLRSTALPYFNLIDHIFSEYGLPQELKYLAVIESNLQTSATSWAGATGPWQFMPSTARDFGLVVIPGQDDRRDYIKSTHAAAQYLLQLYRKMHDWLLVIAAYNGGPGRVYEAIKKSGSRNFWELQHYLPEESRNHVKKFIATHYVMESNESLRFGIPTPGNQEENPFDNNPKLTTVERENAETLTISGKYHSKVIAEHLGITTDEFAKYNPLFDVRLGRNGQYDLMLPADKMAIFKSERYIILNNSVNHLLGEQEVPATRTVYPKKSTKRRS